MTIEELHSNEELRRHEFPVCGERIYLGHAGVSPLPRRVLEAIERYSREVTLNDQEVVLPEGWLNETRQLAARLIDAKAGEIAFVGPTSLALSFVANGLKFRRNDNVIIYHDDYPSNVYPWMTMAERGIEVRFLNIREYGVVRPRDVLGQVDENTRMVCLASCHFIAGYRIDLERIGKDLRDRKILFCVDGIQTIGAFPTPAPAVDFMAADAHKWLLGPCGAGIMYVRTEVQERLQPTAWGWNNVRCPNYVAQDELVYKPDARKYEAGTHNLLGIVGLRASMELLEEIGIRNIANESLRKRAWLVPALQSKGYTVLQATVSNENAGPMISFFKPGGNIAEVHAQLESHKIVTSLRADRTGQRYIRMSPHFYNTDAELQRVLELL